MGFITSVFGFVSKIVSAVAKIATVVTATATAAIGAVQAVGSLYDAIAETRRKRYTMYCNWSYGPQVLGAA